MECKYSGEKASKETIGIKGEIIQGKSGEKETNADMEENFRGCRIPDPGQHEEEL